jgi:GAF domain-containing protein
VSSSSDQGSGLLLPPSVCQALCHELPRASSLDAAMQVAERIRHSTLGDGLLTVNLNLSAWEAGGAAIDSEEITLQRIWTSNPTAYPVAGRKRKTLTPWTRQLLLQAEEFVGEGEEVLREVFHDHTLISSLGLKAVVNIPLLQPDGRCFATFNVLGTRPQWAADTLWLLRLLAAQVTPAVHRDAQHTLG